LIVVFFIQYNKVYFKKIAASEYLIILLFLF